MATLSRPLRLGTRASPLALAQADLVRDALMRAHGWDAEAIEIHSIVATGDRIQDRALAEVGGKALWTKELEAALLAEEIDFAVHSMKDVETVRPADFALAAMLPRADVRDRLVGAPSIAALPRGARLGTSAPRRRAQMLRLRPDLEIALLRGNVQTRLAKLERGEVDATLLAAAGLERLGLHEIGAPIAIDQLLPAPSQGAIGMEICAGNAGIARLLAVINDMPTWACVEAERAFLSGLSGDCRSPVAALATMEGDMIRLKAEIYSVDGAHMEAGEAVLARGAEGAAALGRDTLARAHSAVRDAFPG